MKTISHTLFVLLVTSFISVNAATFSPYKGHLKSPSFILNDVSGKSHNLKDYQGQVVLVQFWATYCTPCRTEMPSMNRLQKKLEKQGFKILAINMAEEKQELEKFIAEVRPEFTILHDSDGAVLQKWKVFAAPASFLLNKTGEIKYVLYGGVEWDSPEIIKVIEAILN